MTAIARQSIARLLRSCRGPCSRCIAAGDHAAVFKALSDPNRVALLARLADRGRACTVSEIACCLPVDLSVVSRHLGQLRDAGILHADRRGKEVYYEVQYGKFVDTLRTLADAIETCCPDGTCDSNSRRRGASTKHQTRHAGRPSNRRRK